MADYFAASQQIQEAIPLYLRVLELTAGRFECARKTRTGFALTNQRDKAIEMLEEIISKRRQISAVRFARAVAG